MITEDLITYILEQNRKDIPKSVTVSRLESAGWHIDDIEEAFIKIKPPIIAPKVEIPPLVIEPEVKVPVIEEKKEENVSYEPIKPVFATSFREAHAPETPVSRSYYIPNNFTQTPGVKPASTPVEPVIKPQVKVEPVASSPAQPKIIITPPVAVQVPDPAPVPTIVPPVTETHLEIRNEELMPVIAAKPVAPLSAPEPQINIVPAIVTPTPIPHYEPAPQVEQPVLQSMATLNNEAKLTPSPQAYQGSIPGNAMLYSYSKDMLSANKIHATVTHNNKKKIFKWLVLILILSSTVGVAVAFAASHIKLPSFNFALVKKDPKTILINAPLEFGALKSYKTQTNATLSLPSFADISSGLITGNKVPSNDTDFVAASAKGSVDNSTAPTLLFDDALTISSSFFKKDITTDLKYNDGIAFFTVPDLRQLLGVDAPPVDTVLINDGQFDPLFQLLPDGIQNIINKADMHKVLSIGVPSYIDKDTASIFKDFINTASVIEKPSEIIGGVDTYHYELSADSISTKTFLTRFTNVFIGDLSDSDRQSLNDALGSVSIDSLEVWIGKKDSMIYQYKFSASAPLSKVIGLDDQGIAGAVVRLDWKTTYSDFNVPNSVILPTNAISLSSFMNIVNDAKVKNIISMFNAVARPLRNAEGSYGKRANPTGSCTNPNPSSLFSPVGQPAGASTAVGTIASTMNNILNLTNGSLACYSTPDAWAMAAPLASKPSQYICADSTGTTSTLSAPITGPSCK